MPSSPETGPNKSLPALQARVATLEQLLDVYERSVLDQAARLEAEQKLLRLQTTLLESQGEASPDAVLSVSRGRRILFSNRRIADLWGIKQPLPGLDSLSSVFEAMARTTTDPASFLAGTESLAEDAEHREECLLLDGRTFERYTAPIRGSDGMIVGRIWCFRDVSAARRVAQLKDEFISNVSHELRTPLTAIRGSLGLVAGEAVGRMPEEARALVEMACRGCDRLERIVNDILDVEKIEAGQMEFHWQVLPLGPLLEQAVKWSEGFGDRYGVSYLVEAGAPGASVRVDPDRLTAVITNLLSNATKFSPRGGTVTLRPERRGDRIRISVQDHGPGIPEEFQPRVFEKFAQAETANDMETAGTGLGLSIARAIVLRLGGEIGFESDRNGTTFWFDLPEWPGGAGPS